MESVKQSVKNLYPRIFDIEYNDLHDGGVVGLYQCANIELNYQKKHPNSRIHGLDAK